MISDKTFGRLFAGGAVAMVIYILILILGIIGWVIDLFKIIHHINDPMTGMFILRIIGIFAAPLGSILGLFF